MNTDALTAVINQLANENLQLRLQLAQAQAELGAKDTNEVAD